MAYRQAHDRLLFDTGPNDTTLLVSESPYSAKYLMIFGIKFNTFFQNGGRHKISKLKPKFGNKKGEYHLWSAPRQAHLASCLSCFLVDNVWWKTPDLRRKNSESDTKMHLEWTCFFGDHDSDNKSGFVKVWNRLLPTCTLSILRNVRQSV